MSHAYYRTVIAVVLVSTRVLPLLKYSALSSSRHRPRRYLWDDPGLGVYRLTANTSATGFSQIPGAVSGGYGRKVFLQGSAEGSGCWFSTDYDANDLWTANTNASSMNAAAIALSAWGPWFEIGPTPWAPRASAALTQSPDKSFAIFASGVSFAGGVPVAPTFGDVWRIETTVCLVSSLNGEVCAGKGFPNAASVTCSCFTGYSGRTCDNISPFTQLTPNALIDVPDLTNAFGPEDKFLAVQYGGINALIFVDLDIEGFLYVSTNKGLAWSKYNITALPCPDPAQPPAPLLPRDSGYTIGLVKNNLTGDDRLLLIGGDGYATNNVYYADAPYTTWMCWDGDQVFSAREFAPFYSIPGTPGTFMGGGIVSGQLTVGVFQAPAWASGIVWQRPPCASPPCPFPYSVPPVNSYVFPFTPVLPGQLASDWNTTYLWDDLSPAIFYVTNDTVGVGFQPAAGMSGGYGRKLFIKGGQPGSGCWLSTDYNADELWVIPNVNANSMNTIAIAQAAGGPWIQLGSAPWLPRASAAFTTSGDGTMAYLASGVTFKNGVSMAPVFGDVWSIDVSVCLVSQYNQKVCGGPAAGTPFLNNVTCACNPGYYGRACDPPSPSNTPTPSSTPSTSLSSTSTPTGTGTPTGSVSRSASASASPSSSSTGSSSASNSRGVSRSSSRTASRTPTPKVAPPPADAGVSGAAVGAGVSVGLLVAAAGGLFVWGRYFGGAAVMRKYTGAGSAGFAKLGKGVSAIRVSRSEERSSLLKSSAAASTARLETLGVSGSAGVAAKSAGRV